MMNIFTKNWINIDENTNESNKFGGFYFVSHSFSGLCRDSCSLNHMQVTCEIQQNMKNTSFEQQTNVTVKLVELKRNGFWMGMSQLHAGRKLFNVYYETRPTDVCAFCKISNTQIYISYLRNLTESHMDTDRHQKRSF